MLDSERHRRNERAAAIQSMGILLDRHKQQEFQHQNCREWSDTIKWGSDANNNCKEKRLHNYSYEPPRSILKCNNVGTAPIGGFIGKEKAPILDLNNNTLSKGGEDKDLNGKNTKKGLRWKEADEEICHQEQQEWRNSFVGNNEPEDTFRCCTVCGGRIWAGDKKSTIFGNEQKDEGQSEGELLVHWACFRCATCGLDLGAEQQEKVFKREGRFYCQVHGPMAATMAEQKLKTRAEGKGKAAAPIAASKPLPPTQHPSSMGINRREWWERSADEFNGNKKSSTTFRYYGEGNKKMLSNLYNSSNFMEAEKQKKIEILSEKNIRPMAAKFTKREIEEEAKSGNGGGGKMTAEDGFKGKNGASNGKFKRRGKDGEDVDFCEHCGVELSHGSLVLAKGHAWCPEHFCCANSACARPLLESGFVEDPDQPHRNYCPKCYEMLIAPVCQKCSLPLTESCLNALGQKWHPDCFCCAYCRRPFGTLSFFVENGKPYCENDWNQLFTAKCAECREPIKVGQKWLEALGGRSFHAECFKCTTCRIKLEGKTFFEREQRPYCRAHATTKRI